MKKYWFILTVLISLSAIAQTNDSFSDNDFTQYPAWSGSSSHFVINATQQLQLNNTVSATSWLSTDFGSASLASTTWAFFIKLGFAPSANNNARVYIVSDHAELSQPLTGYFLQFGESGSQDAIELFRQDGNAVTSICRGTPGRIAASFSASVKVVRDIGGNWTIYADYLGGDDYVQEAQGTDDLINTSEFLGVLCTYTSSNGAKFFFDDFSVASEVTDQEPPELDSMTVLGQNELKLAFSEALDPAQAEDATHYSANNSIGNPTTASLLSDHKTILLTFATAFKNGMENDLSIIAVKDLSGNEITPNSYSFTFSIPVKAEANDVIISEIFPDPLPSIGLPEAEFVEIYNRSDHAFNLTGWKISDGVTTGTLPNRIILPQQYFIITATSNAGLFTPPDYVISLSGFPSLNNTGDHLTLKDPEASTVDSVAYTSQYFRDEEKADGGWSIELIDLHNPCGEQDNWIASEDPTGGTPGRQNSVNANKPDLTSPRLLTVTPIDSLHLVLGFDEKLDSQIPDIGSFSLMPEIPKAVCAFADESLTHFVLTLSSPLHYRQLYSITVIGIRDCNGNLVDENFDQLNFAMPEAADSLDILVNEILFNPRPGGVDFVEIVNTSHKYIDVSQWKVARLDANVPVDAKEIEGESFLIAPGSLLAFTSDLEILKDQYLQSDEKRFYKTSLPSFSDDEGSVALLDESGNIIDFFFYSEKFHSELIKDHEGVSLERISFSGSNGPENWKSGTAAAGFATPGAQNSNARPTKPVADGTIAIDPEVFIPGSGMSDFTTINYAFDQPGYIANVRILDHAGRTIKDIANNDILGYEGFYRWDGNREDGSRARMGYYLVWFEIFDLSGKVQTFRERVVVVYR